MTIEPIAIDGVPVDIRRKLVGYIVTDDDLIELREIAELMLNVASHPDGRTRVVKELNEWIDRIEDGATAY